MHQPKKRFGQHFLHDHHVVSQIVSAFSPTSDDPVVEIGPGTGVLTRALLEKLGHLYAVELDRDLAVRLSAEFSPEHFTLHSADALKFDFCRLAPSDRKLRLIGNLPYNISTPLLFHLLDQAGCIQDMLFMLQKEVVDRMCAEPDGKDYGRLSVMIQYRCAVEKLFDVAPGSFTPPPRVDSSVVRLVPHAKPPVEINDPEMFARLVQAAFTNRRKVLRNTLKGLVTAETMSALGIDPVCRAETLSLAEFAALSNAATA